MKKFCTIIAALAVLVSCQKQPSEEEKKAEVEKQVQERLAAEHQKEEQARLAQQQANPPPAEQPQAEKQDEVAEVASTLAVPDVVAQAKTVRREPETFETSEQPTTASYGTFYRKLEPYGAWRETSDYGYVWQPREAESRDWRPYTDGHWVYTDAGWTWVSEEPFGWATYHYGRWVRLRRVGWVWVPGEEWAPAWVSWRTSKDYVGWAPLPPEARFDRKHGIHNWADNYYDITPDQYSFVPGNEFGARRVQTSIVPVERNITIVIETTNVTNITYSNTTVVNQGPNYEEIRTRSKQPIERYRLQRQIEMNSDTSKPIVRGEVLEVSAPVITRVPGIDRPQKVKETLTEATVEKTWAPETDRAASERARAKMKTEVTPPPDAPSKKFVRPIAVIAVTPNPSASVATAPLSVTTRPTVVSTATPSTSVPAAQPTATAISTPVRSQTVRPTPPAVSSPNPSASVATAPLSITTRPTAVSTPTPSTSVPAAQPTATPISTPVRSQTVRPTPPAVSSPTPRVAPSPTAPLRKPLATRPPRPSPSSTMTPAPSASPEAAVAPPTPAPISTPSVTPDRAAQLRQLPRRSPSPWPSAAKSSERDVKPLPTPRPPRPVVTPLNTPTPAVVPPVSEAPTKPPAKVEPSASPVASPPASNAKSDKRKTRSPGQLEDTQPMPIPTPTPPSQ